MPSKNTESFFGALQHAHFLELGVIRTFDFVSSLRRMSVLVKKLKSQTIEAYVKGAPEVMIDICSKESREYAPPAIECWLSHCDSSG